MDLVLVGVGPWGRLLARKLTEAGARVVAYTRASGPDVDGLGVRIPLTDLWSSGRFDGLIAAAPPAVTLALSTQAASHGMAVLATKPLMLTTPLAITAPFFVDHARLWSRCYGLLKQRIAGHAIRSIDVAMVGNGPIRAFSSLDDYGPHALAFVHDLLGHETVLEQLVAEPILRRADGATLHRARAQASPVALRLHVGNAADGPTRRLSIKVDGIGTEVYEEGPSMASWLHNGKVVLQEPQDPLAAMAAQFISEFQQRVADPRHVALSVAVARSLRAINKAEGHAPAT